MIKVMGLANVVDPTLIQGSVFYFALSVVWPIFSLAQLSRLVTGFSFLFNAVSKKITGSRPTSLEVPSLEVPPTAF